MRGLQMIIHSKKKWRKNIMKKLQKIKRGGTRQGSGAKPKYNEQTKTVAFRCPMSKVDELKLIVKSKLSEWSVK
jgi:hypothetical protein